MTFSRRPEDVLKTFVSAGFPIKLYQYEEDPTKGQMSDKDVECFLCLVVSILNSEKEIK